MEIRTFVADSMPDALDKVRRALGSDAVLMKTRMVNSGNHRHVEITAAADKLTATQAATQPSIDGQAWEQVTDALEGAKNRIATLEDGGDACQRWLAECDFHPELADSILDDINAAADPLAAANNTIASRMKVGQGLLPLPDQARRIALIGPPGAGKTSALVKLAAQAVSTGRTDVALVNLDTYRPGAEEYLAQVGDTLTVPVLSERTPDVQKGLVDVEGLLLIDTDSRIFSTDPGGASVRASLSRLKPDVIALVLPATWRAVDLKDAVGRYLVCRPTHLVFSGLDLTIRYGGIISVAAFTGLPVACVLTTGRFDCGTKMFRPEALLQQMQSLYPQPATKQEVHRG